MDPATSRPPIALVGIGCRFPGAADPFGYWRLLAGGVDAVREVSADRWDPDVFYDPDPAKPGKIMSKRGGYLDQVDLFDWRAFRISPREAKFVDPQHRLLLEVAWEALEDGGLPLERLAGSRTAVFVGIMWNDYAKLAARDYSKLEGYNANGNSFAYSANRISYFFDLRGPSVAVDVQCASSLTSVHLACQSLWSGEADAALAGGVNLIISPDTNIAMSKAAILSPEGRVKTWDAAADGFVRGEGAGVVVLKPLEQALADGDRVYAVIRSSVTTHGGKTDWIMAPSRRGQEHLLREAYRQAAIDPRAVDYVELHGTGTKVGDPVEAAALGAVVGAGRNGDACLVGSVKTNIGHLDSAAGIAGLIKTALAIHHRRIPPSLHYHTHNPAIPQDELGLSVATTLTPWPERGHPPLAGVTALSFGGGHAHVVLEAAPAVRPVAARPPSRPYVLPLSAKSAWSLRELARAFADFLADDGDGRDASVLDVCYTASLRRSHHDHRAAITAGSREELVEGLRAVARGESWPGAWVGQREAQPVRPVFVFSGQGTPWWSTGRELLALEPTFRKAVAAADQRMRPHARWSLLDELTRDPASSRLARTAFAQPATYALQTGLAALWRSWGVEPAAVIGHSVGEVAAAATSGAISQADAARLVVHRGQLMRDAPSHPAMAAVLLPLADAEALVADLLPNVAVAADNAPSATLVSGEADALETVLARCRERGVYAMRLTEHDVFHRAPRAYGDALASWLDPWETSAARVPFYSTLTGQEIDGRLLDAAYWGRQMAARVEFRAAVEAALDAGHDTFLELAAHPVLAGPLTDCLQARGTGGIVISSLRRGEHEQRSMLDAVAHLYVRGYPVAWAGVLAGPGRVISLPTHPWERERMWHDVGDVTAPVEVSAAIGHPLLGRHLAVALTDEHVWDSALDRGRLRWLDDHRVQGVAVLPGAGYVEMVAAAVEEALGWSRCTLSDVQLRAALVVPDEGGRRVQVVLTPRSGEFEFRVVSRADKTAAWTLHVTGRVREGAGDDVAVDVDAVRGPLHERVDGPACYRRFLEQGEQYGPSFQGIDELWRRDGEVLARMRAPTPILSELSRFRFHPAFLDACMHALVMADTEEAVTGGFMPVHIAEVAVSGRLDAEAWSHVRLAPRDDDEDAGGQVDADIVVSDATGDRVMTIRGLRLQYLDEAALRAPLPERWYYRVGWEELPAPAQQPVPGTWVVLADASGVGDALAQRITASGASCRVVAADRSDDLAAALAADDLRGVVHLWALDAPSFSSGDGSPGDGSTATATAEELEAAEERACGAVLALVRHLSGRRPAPRLHLVTRGCQTVTDDDPPAEAAQAVLWGFGRSLAQERPELWGGLLDLDPAQAADGAAEAVWEHLCRSDGEDQCARRGGSFYAARVLPVRVPPLSAPAVAWRRDAAYLITGGLGDLGLRVARWMVEQGARRLILAGRTPLPPRQEWSNAAAGTDVVAARVAAVRELESLGATVHLAAVDVGDEEQLRAFLDGWVAEGWPAIRGVVHAAGVAPFEAVEQMTTDGMLRVLRPKVSGGWLLHRLLADAELDFFVLFSSASAVLSSPRLAHYAGGNAFLDALAHHRHRRGLPALSIVWGPWAEVGMATRTGTGGPASLRGMRLIPLDEGLDAMHRLMGRRDPVVAVLPVEWAEWRESYRAAAAAPILREVAGEAQAAAAPTGGGAETAAGSPLQTLLAAPREERETLVRTAVADQVGDVLRVPADRLGPDQSLAELGFDSLMAMELRSRLATRVGADLSILEILGADTVPELADLLVGRVAEIAAAAPYDGLGAATEGEAVAGGDIDWLLEQLTDDDVEALLAELEVLA